MEQITNNLDHLLTDAIFAVLIGCARALSYRSHQANMCARRAEPYRGHPANMIYLKIVQIKRITDRLQAPEIMKWRSGLSDVCNKPTRSRTTTGTFDDYRVTRYLAPQPARCFKNRRLSTTYLVDSRPHPRTNDVNTHPPKLLSGTVLHAPCRKRETRQDGCNIDGEKTQHLN